MKRKFISAEESFKRWRKDPKYVAAYDALEEEFALASALIKARSAAEMTQEQVAEAMGTTQAVVARLESGKVLPSTRTLERFAKATRTRLRISFEPDHEAARRASRIGKPACVERTGSQASQGKGTTRAGGK
jgi:ribosome-binding protein aMBF1 (putative translation factor)